MTRWRLAVLFALAAVGTGAELRAQGELPATLSRATRDTIERLIDVARVAGLPTEPLVAKAHEGVLKRASEERILWAVRVLMQRQADARSILPGKHGNLGPAVSALQAGVSLETLRKLASRGVDNGDLEFAFVTVADLVANKVPAEAAAASVEKLLLRRAPLAEYQTFRATVAQDIAAGRSPEAALASRTEALVRTLDDRRAAPVRPAQRP
jgi:hypothetical protein